MGWCSKLRHLCQFEAYVDADWIGNLSDRRSTSEYCVFFGRNLVQWRSTGAE